MSGKAIVIRGNASKLPLPDESVDLIISSPPYFALRSYRDSGEHYPGQIGSEPTPQEWLEALWACMAEWWRVLKPTGSVFVNLGDKRAGSGAPGTTTGLGPGSQIQGKRSGITGPYVTAHARGKNGTTARWTKESATWLAAVIDCDGCIFVGRPRADVASARAAIIVEMGDPEVPERVAAITGVGKIRTTDKRTIRWEATGPQAGYVLQRIWPWLLIKQRQALAAIEMCRLKEANYGRNIVTDSELNYRAQIADAIADWNQRRANPWQPPRCAYPHLPTGEFNPRAKSKLLLPHRFAIGCEDGLADPQGIGWIVRQDLCWQKLNGLPESTKDRHRDSHEFIFHLTKQERYFAAMDEIRLPNPRSDQVFVSGGAAKSPNNNGDRNDYGNPIQQSPLGSLPGSVWPMASEPLVIPQWAKEKFNLPDHFAAFPTELPRKLILAFSPSGICLECGEGRRPVVQPSEDYAKHLGGAGMSLRGVDGETGLEMGHRTMAHREHVRYEATITGYACAPGCDSKNPTRPAVVADFFSGTGTVPMVAKQLGRIGIGIDLSADYCRLAAWRIAHPPSKVMAKTWQERQGTLL